MSASTIQSLQRQFELAAGELSGLRHFLIQFPQDCDLAAKVRNELWDALPTRLRSAPEKKVYCRVDEDWRKGWITWSWITHPKGHECGDLFGRFDSLATAAGRLLAATCPQVASDPFGAWLLWLHDVSDVQKRTWRNPYWLTHCKANDRIHQFSTLENLCGASALALSKLAEARGQGDLPNPSATAPAEQAGGLEFSAIQHRDRLLQVIHDLGRGMEAHPRDHLGKDEETLRAHFVATLRTLPGNTTAETLNSKGKTDIFVQSDGGTVLVAECKNWSGPKGLLDAINQLLGNLTWQNSEAAAVFFVRGQKVSSVLRMIEEKCPSHPCFVKALGKQNDGWLNFQFQRPKDDGVSIHLTILVFHFPKAGESTCESSPTG